jgi:TolB-like protein
MALTVGKLPGWMSGSSKKDRSYELSDSGSHQGGFFTELRRRKVIRVALTYGIVGFAVIEAADIIVDAIALPAQFVAFVIVTIFLGLPIAIVLAWSYDIVPDSAIREAASADVKMQAPPSPVIRVLQAVAAVGVVLILGYSWFTMNSDPTVETRSADARYVDSVAVMPLDNLTGDKKYDHLGIGITEEIITHLARIPELKVISRHSVEAVDEQRLTIPQIGAVLGVRHVIEGSVRIDGDVLRITLQHVDAETDDHAWAENFQGNIANPIAVQEDVARLATNRVVEMIPGARQPVYSSHVDLGPGQQAYIEGQRFLGQRTSEGINRAIEQLEHAIEIDPKHAPAYAALSSAYALSLVYRYDIGIDGYEAAARAAACAERALQLDSNLAAGYAARGYLGVYINRSPAAIATDFERAAQIQPNAASIPSWRALSLAQLGRIDEALTEARRAVELDPLAPSRRIALASISFELGQFDNAILAGRMATALEPRMIRGRVLEARSMLLSGRAVECANMILGPHRVLRATCLIANGQNVEAEKILNRVLEDIRNGEANSSGYTEVTTYEDLAVHYAQLGNPEMSLSWVVRAYSVSPTGIEPRLLNSALFETVRDDKNFRASVEAIQNNLYDRVQNDSRGYL